MNNRRLRNKDVELLASISLGLRGEYEKAGVARWQGSPFEWILHRPSRQRGKIGEQLIAGWCAARGLDVVRSPDSDADRIIEGARVEIKFSTEWENGQYVFQQLRDQNYTFLICLGISPFDAQVWILEKSKIPFEKLKHQHGGERGHDTWWIGFQPGHPPAWMQKRGSLAEVYKVLARLKKNRKQH